MIGSSRLRFILAYSQGDGSIGEFYSVALTNNYQQAWSLDSQTAKVRLAPRGLDHIFLNVAGECWLVYFKSCECFRPDLILAPAPLSLNGQ